MKIKFYPDAGHGWYAVKRRVINEFGLATKISGYSYQRGQTVYLEEDGDATAFFTELKNRVPVDQIKIIEPSSWPDRSPIRSYESYQPQLV